MTLQDEEGPIDEQIASLLASAIPPSWRSAVLEIEFVRHPNDAEGFVHKIRSPEGHREPISPPDEMYESTIQLYDLFSRAGRPWRRVRYQVTETPEGEWDYRVAFEY